MPLTVDLEADINENCAEVLRPWAPVTIFFDSDEPEGNALECSGMGFETAHEKISTLLAPLRALRLSDCSATAAQISELLALPVLANLEVLMMPRCLLGKEGGVALSQASLPKLRFLDLRETAIADRGAIAIAKSRLIGHLEYLAVAGAFLTVAGLDALLLSPMGERAASLHVEEEDQRESLMPTLLQKLGAAAVGPEPAALKDAFVRFIAHPALTEESRAELRYQWGLIMSS